MSEIQFVYPLTPFYVEFGAHDGISNSNLRFLAENSHPGIFIESSKKLFKKLKKNVEHLPILPLLNMLDARNNSLEKVLKRNNIKFEEIVIISIDIDSDDAEIFRTIDWPLLIVVVEYNPTIPFDSDFMQPAGKNWGNSAKSIVKIANTKDLYLIAITETNLIFLNRSFIHIIPMISLFDNHELEHQLRFALAYDGSILLFSRSGLNFTKEVLPLGWTRANFVQPLPKFLRKFKKLEKLKIVYSTLKILARVTAYSDVFRYIRKHLKG